jgi:chemotaxis protein CheD
MALATEISNMGEVFLNPGNFHFHCPVPGRAQPARLRTLLGSCVSIVMWHPERRIGGMSHIILPGRNRRDASLPLDGRYAEEVMTLFQREVIRAGTLPQQYQVYLVGGGNMYQTVDLKNSVGTRNIAAARAQLQKHGFTVRAEHVGTTHHRKLELDLGNGVVTVICNNLRIELAV